MRTLVLTPSCDERDNEARNDHKEGDTARETPPLLQYLLRSSPKRSRGRILVSKGYRVRVSHVSVNPS